MHCRRPYTPDAETLRAMSVTDPRAHLKALYDTDGPDGVRARIRLGGIESRTALTPGDFNQLVDATRI